MIEFFHSYSKYIFTFVTKLYGVVIPGESVPQDKGFTVLKRELHTNYLITYYIIIKPLIMNRSMYTSKSQKKHVNFYYLPFTLW